MNSRCEPVRLSCGGGSSENTVGARPFKLRGIARQCEL